ncbi:uncharacterized protein TM35_000301930 [Trypanosoma theileri]|uniref:Uncharacterized protein n=1 Tax=Trypanosoma theileri TaxID=67003 RepID=A0A1X0NNS3_9TRYP|nr:uncharacterized protein TM35_000301930 [Trypanosoma theileri]ORC86153.1 hypothetical protein TM35_000301930 [Trypanosoma theileri]
MDRLSIILYRINPDDYPQYMQCERSSEQPGTLLMESRAMQGVRRVVPVGYLFSLFYFYAYYRPRLPFADRSLARLHHYFYPSAGYSTPIGIISGLAYACVQDGYTDCSLESVKQAKERERGRAIMAWKQQQQLQREMEKEMEGNVGEATLRKWLSWCGVSLHPNKQKPPVSQRETSYEDFLDPNGIISVGKQTREIHDPSFYHYYTKEQVDALVSKAMKLRQSPDEERWLKTSGRLGAYGIMGMLLLWNSGGLFFRLFMGLGLGVVSASVISGTKLDA